jgi:hypothetical protein
MRRICKQFSNYVNSENVFKLLWSILMFGSGMKITKTKRGRFVLRAEDGL